MNNLEKLMEIKEELYIGTYGDEFTGYSGGNIHNIIHYIADNNTSVYNYDVIEFISENPSELTMVIDTGFYDPTYNYDIYDHGRAAEYHMLYRELSEDLADILKNYAIDYIIDRYVEISDDQLREIEYLLCDVESYEYIEDLREDIDAIFTNDDEEVAE